MNTNHGAQIELRNSSQPLLEAISNSLQRVIKRVADSREAARYESALAKLPPHLRYDVGELDCIPPACSRQVQHSYQDTLEAMWQRSM